MAGKRKFHDLHRVSNRSYPWHCRACEQYFSREPKAATCTGKQPEASVIGEEALDEILKMIPSGAGNRG